jgi:hypothetical protein
VNNSEKFLADFEAWVVDQIAVNQMALDVTQLVQDEGGNFARDTAEALVRYEAKMDAYKFLMSKFDNYHNGRDFHDLPDGLLGERNY